MNENFPRIINDPKPFLLELIEAIVNAVFMVLGLFILAIVAVVTLEAVGILAVNWKNLADFLLPSYFK